MLSIIFKTQVTLARLLDEDTGQGVTEYALILVLIAIVAITALALLGGSVTDGLSSVARTI